MSLFENNISNHANKTKCKSFLRPTLEAQKIKFIDMDVGYLFFVFYQVKSNLVVLAWFREIW